MRPSPCWRGSAASPGRALIPYAADAILRHGGAWRWDIDRRNTDFGAWAGGEAALAALFKRFYEKVPPILGAGAVFAGMDPHHAKHVAAFVTKCGRRAELYRRGAPHPE